LLDRRINFTFGPALVFILSKNIDLCQCWFTPVGVKNVNYVIILLLAYYYRVIIMTSADVENSAPSTEMQSNDEDPVENMIQKTGCMDLHYKLQVDIVQCKCYYANGSPARNSESDRPGSP